MTFYCIKHMPSGNIIPCADGRMGRGGSYVEPAQIVTTLPRIFSEKRYAKSWLTTWLKGKQVMHQYTSYEGEHNCRIETIPQPHRKRKEYKIVSISFRTGK